MDLAALLDAIPDPIVVVDGEARLCWANEAAEVATGWSREAHRGRTVDHLVHPDDLATALVSLASVQEKRRGTLVEIRVRVAAGGYRTFEVRGAPSAALGVDGAVLSMRDVTDRYGWEIAAGDADLHHAVLDRAPTITLLLGPDRAVRSATRALTLATGRSLESTLGHDVLDLVEPDERPAVAAELELVAVHGGRRSFEASFTGDAGRPVRMSLTAVGAVDDDALRGIVLGAVDITRLDEARRRLRHLATHDPLTGLPNRMLLLDQLAAMLTGATPGAGTGVIYCDVDGFKGVNDALGHGGGDRVLVQVAERLSEVVRAGDVVGRLAGDEFVILLPETTPAVLREVTARIDGVMRAPFVLDGGEAVAVSISTGWALGDGRAEASDLLARADLRMYGQKRRRAATAQPR